MTPAVRSAQWHAFNKVLNWINEREFKMLPKKELYHAVMAMRPEEQEDMATVFKCNFCERRIEVKHFDAPDIKCYCGAKYTKTVTITISQKKK